MIPEITRLNLKPSNPPLMTSSCKCLAVDQRHCAWSNEPEPGEQSKSLHTNGEITFWQVRTTPTQLRPFARHLVGKIAIQAAHLLITEHQPAFKKHLKAGMVVIHDGCYIAKSFHFWVVLHRKNRVPPQKRLFFRHFNPALEKTSVEPLVMLNHPRTTLILISTLKYAVLFSQPMKVHGIYSWICPCRLLGYASTIWSSTLWRFILGMWTCPK